MPSELLIDYGKVEVSEDPPTQQEVAFQQMTRLLRTVEAVKAWAPTVKNRLLRAYLAPQPEGLRLFAIARSREDCDPLHRSLLDMTTALLDESDVLLDTMVLLECSPDELRAFFEPDAALLLSWR